jgi:hypothetical protein
MATPRKTAAKKPPARKATQKAVKKAAPKRSNAKGAVPGQLDPYVPYSDDVADAVCARIAEGDSVRKIASIHGMPSKSAIFKWLAEHEDFRLKYEAATEERAQSRYESIDEIIDDLRAQRIDHRQARVMVDTVKWQCAIERPDRYGQVNRHEHTGKGGGPMQHQNLPPAQMTPEQRLEEIRQLLTSNPDLLNTIGTTP